MVYVVVFLLDNVVEYFIMSKAGTITSLTGVSLACNDMHDRILSELHVGPLTVGIYLITFVIWLFRFYF